MFGTFLFTGRFMRRRFDEPSDALRVFPVRLRNVGDRWFEFREPVQQLRFVFGWYMFGRFNCRLYFVDMFVRHAQTASFAYLTYQLTFHPRMLR